MTALAVLNIVFGGLGIASGLLRVPRSIVLMYESWRLNVLMFSTTSGALIALLILAAGVVGLIAGIGIFALRPWARTLSLVYGGLFVFSSVVSFAASIVSSHGAYDVTIIMILVVMYVAIPVAYALVLFLAFQRPGWKATFADGSAA
jgi:uncharacterized membrane protein (DUF2068 family)